MAHADFNQGALCPSGHDRPGRAPGHWLHPLKGSGPAAGDLGKISGKHPENGPYKFVHQVIIFSIICGKLVLVWHKFPIKNK